MTSSKVFNTQDQLFSYTCRKYVNLVNGGTPGNISLLAPVLRTGSTESSDFVFSRTSSDFGSDSAKNNSNSNSSSGSGVSRTNSDEVYRNLLTRTDSNNDTASVGTVGSDSPPESRASQNAETKPNQSTFYGMVLSKLHPEMHERFVATHAQLLHTFYNCPVDLNCCFFYVLMSTITTQIHPPVTLAPSVHL